MADTIKTAVAIPKDIFTQTDVLAKELKVSRSVVVSMALKALIHKFENKCMQAKINEAFDDDHTQEDLENQALAESSMLEIWKDELLRVVIRKGDSLRRLMVLGTTP